MIVVKLLIHFLTSTNYELHRDEMLYFSMGGHLSWGFASTPPFISFLAFIVKNVFGYSEFFVKLFPALFGASILLLVALLIRDLGGKGFAVFSGCFAIIISTSMLRSSSLFMPVIIELFFWMLFLYFVFKLISTQNPRYWIAIGISFGLAFLNKYSILVLGFSTFIAFLVSDHRKILLSKYLIYGIIAGLLIMLPNIIWQINHGFAVYTHMSELYRTQLVNVSPLNFILDQIMMNFSSFLIWFTGLVGVLFFKQERRYRLFGYILILVVFMFLILKGKSYYTLGVYSIMFAFGGYYLEKYFVGRLKTLLSYLIIIVSFAFGMLLLPLGLPVLPQKGMEKYCTFFSKYVTPAPMRSEDNTYYPLPQDYMDMTGWKELSALVSTVYDKLDSNQKNDCIVYANNYGQAGAIDFYGKQYGLPTPICVNDSYIFWAPDSLSAYNFIVIDDQLGDIPIIFKNYSEVGEIQNIYFRENGLKVYLCQDPKPLLKSFFKNRIKANKEIYKY